MRIDRLDVYYVSMPLIYPWRTAYGEDHAIDSVLVKATADGITAWSEATPFRAPHYVPESAGSVYHLVSEILRPAGRRPRVRHRRRTGRRAWPLSRATASPRPPSKSSGGPSKPSAPEPRCTPCWAAPTPT